MQKKHDYKLREDSKIVLGLEEIPFTIVRSKRRKRTMSFSLAENASLAITVPYLSTSDAINATVRKHAHWIKQKLQEMVHQQPSPRQKYQSGSIVKYLGHDYPIVLKTHNAKGFGCALKEGHLEITCGETPLAPSDLHEAIRLELLLWLKKRAKIVFAQRLKIWSHTLHLAPKRLIVSSPKRRWGSCSSDNTLRLNWRLIMASTAIIDYVLVHELAHIQHKNHSKRFWEWVRKAMPDYEERHRALKMIARELSLE